MRARTGTRPARWLVDAQRCQRAAVSQLAALRIGRSTEAILRDYQTFLCVTTYPMLLSSPSLSEAIDERITLTLQNGPADVVGTLGGLRQYKRAYLLAKVLSAAYLYLNYRNVALTASPIPSEGGGDSAGGGGGGGGGGGVVHLSLRWRVQGVPRRFAPLLAPPAGAPQRTAATIVAAYSHYTFDGQSGRVVAHVIDRIVPPQPKRGIVAWLFERKLLAY